MNIEKLREDFPILKSGIIYFDNACVSLKPKQVIEAMNKYYYEFPACGQRSEHKLGKKVTESVWQSRKELKKFFNAKSEKEIIFTKNTTESINIVAHSMHGPVLLTDKEHNSNLVPWQVDGKIQIVKSKPDMTFDMDAFESSLKNIKLVSFVHTSNLDGYTIPAREIIKISHEHNIPVMLDAAQSAPHRTIDVKKLDVDFLACSGHKMLGPSGMGILYGKQHMLEKLQPLSLGGDTVSDSTYKSHKLLGVPERLEAGLQNYAGIIGFAEAVKYLEKIGMENIEKHETMMNKLVTE
ncbi:MAG: aminotransferase class V-fold PLP-dependent enzyme, partial [Candidatus Aenigmatarchaeota archaeon]